LLRNAKNRRRTRPLVSSAAISVEADQSEESFAYAPDQVFEFATGG
jgi:hypothetical protein